MGGRWVSYTKIYYREAAEPAHCLLARVKNKCDGSFVWSFFTWCHRSSVSTVGKLESLDG